MFLIFLAVFFILTLVESAENCFIHSAESRKPPVFDVPLKSVSVEEGDKLSLRCHVCGSPPLKVQWMKDRRELTSAGSIRITFSEGTACVDISSASKHDAGDYLCKATNDAGSEFCKAKVTVKGETSTQSKISIYCHLIQIPFSSCKSMFASIF